MSDRDGESGDGGDFRVAVRDSAVAASAAVGDLVAEWGRTATFPSRAVAERVASDLSERGTGRVWIQGAPDATADAYLVGRERVPGEPIARDGDRFTCPVSATQYGAVGEALITAPAPDPALREWIRDDLPVAASVAEQVYFDGDPEPPPVFLDESGGEGDRSGEHDWSEDHPTARRRWVPDYRARARLPDEDRPIRTYWCEVKTGSGTLERSQSAAMSAAARDRTVLLVSVDVSGLPDSYEVAIGRVEPD